MTTTDQPAAASVQSTSFLRRVVGDQIEVKAAGDFGDLAEVRAAASAGADRISTFFTAQLAAAAAAWLRESASLSPQPSLADLGAAVG